MSKHSSEGDRSSMHRRDLLRAAAGASVGAVALGWCTQTRSARATAAESAQRSGAVRLVHFTDSHIRPEFNAVAGVRSAFAHVRANVRNADMLVTGGDLIMHSMDQTAARTAELWGNWSSVYADACDIPVKHCIGNHDIWGWNKRRSESTGSEPKWGKKWWMEMMGSASTYSSFDQGAWHIVILDTIQPLDESYQGRIDEEQFDWLERDLRGVAPNRHTLIITHIPILSVSMLDCDARTFASVASESKLVASDGSPGARERQGLVIGAGAMMMDCHRLLRLFQSVGNVRGCLSGHIHTVEYMRYLGIDFYCNGAVSGMWWRGMTSNRAFGQRRMREGDVPVDLRPRRADPGYAVVDLAADGRIACEYRTYGWTYAED